MTLGAPTSKTNGDVHGIRSPGRRLLRRVATMAVAVVWLGAGGIREDEFQCEQAVAHLHDCCPDLDPGAVSCSFSSSCGATLFTTFSVEESQCIQDASCEAILRGHLCERALSREPRQTMVGEDGGTSTTPEQEPVCP